MSTETTTKQSFPKRIFALDFFSGSGNRAPETKFFEFEGNLAMAREEGRRHCAAMGYRWLKVRPHIVNLKAQEEAKRKAEGDWSEGESEV